MRKLEWIVCGVVASALLTGCTEDESALSYQQYKDADLAPATAHDHDHDHGSHEGVNGGHVIEIGDAHAIHAELVFDKTSRDITLFFYGPKIGEAKVVSGLEFELNQGGSEAAYEAKAAPLDGETAEAASRFVVSGSTLPAEITSEEQLDGHFHVTVDGSEYVGNFHAHTHEAHDHEAGHDHEKGHADDKGHEPAKGDESAAKP